jgi:hypothetical protein
MSPAAPKLGREHALRNLSCPEAVVRTIILLCSRLISWIPNQTWINCQRVLEKDKATVATISCICSKVDIALRVNF